MKNPDFLINKVYNQLPPGSVDEKELYENIKNDKLQHTFSYLQHKINYLLEILITKRGKHYRSEESKELIKIIRLENQLEVGLTDTTYSFTINTQYKNLLNNCLNFLRTSNGSEVPEDIPIMDILWNEPIFEMQQVVEIGTTVYDQAEIQLIGEGSYAHVYKYNDKNYDTTFVLKRAKKNLTDEEINRFKTEYEIMKSLNSPYIVRVFKYNNSKNEYTMEYAEATLEEYLRYNQNLNIASRMSLAKQILRAFKYIHAKDILHRDISPKNILIFKYDDALVAKISDFGLVKLPNSSATSINTDIKGYFNDLSDLDRVGFPNYGMCHEIYALTKILYFTMTGRQQYKNELEQSIAKFYQTGTSANTDERYTNVTELEKAFIVTKWQC